MTGESFSIKYHPVKGLHDFLILRQVFNKSIEKTWIVGTRFRHLNADHVWSFGAIQAMEPFQDKFPKSLFRCYLVRWDNDGVFDTLSPWDLEPIDDSGEYIYTYKNQSYDNTGLNLLLLLLLFSVKTCRQERP